MKDPANQYLFYLASNDAREVLNRYFTEGAGRQILGELQAEQTLIVPPTTPPSSPLTMGIPH